MRLLLVPLFLLLTAFPPAALSGSAAGEGSLAVRDGRGKATLVVRGSLIGRYGNGSLTIEELNDEGSAVPVVRGYERVKWAKNGNSRTYSGRDVRFRLIGGRYRVQFSGRALYFSLVGKGRVMLDGNGSMENRIFYDGFYSLNGLEEESLPDEPTWLTLGPVPPPPPPPPPPPN
jgi:hypothetical protein